MQNLSLAANTVIPLFLLMMLGYILKKIGILKEELLSPLNKIVFSVFLSTSLFNNLYTTKLEEAWNGSAILYVMACIIVIFIILWFIIPRIEKERTKASVMMQSIYRSNVIILGLPVLIELCGAENTGLMSLIIAVAVPIFNILSVFIFQIMGQQRPKLSITLLGIAKNPLIIGCLLGFLFLITGIRLPYVMEKAVSSVASVSTPLSLIVLGGFFDFKKVRGNLKQIIISVTGRLIIVPLLCVGGAILLGFTGSDLVSIMVTFAAPSAVTSFTMAKQMKADADLAAEIVVTGTLVSIVTVFIWIVVLKELMLF